MMASAATGIVGVGGGGGSAAMTLRGSSRGPSLLLRPVLPARRLARRPLRATAAGGGPSDQQQQQQQQQPQQQPQNQDGGVGGAEAAAVGRPEQQPPRSSKSRAGDVDEGGGSGTSSGSGGNRGSGSGQKNRSRQRRRGSPSPSSSAASSSSSSTLFHPLRIAINVAFLFMVMRLWPYSGRATNLIAPSAAVATTATTTTAAAEQRAGGGSEAAKGAAAASKSTATTTSRQSPPPMVVVSVPFSEFMRRLKADEVAAVTVDRRGSASGGARDGGGVVGVAFTLRPAALERLTRGFDSALSDGASSSSADPHGLPPALQKQLEQQRRRQQQQQASAAATTTTTTTTTPTPPVRVTFRTVRPPDYPLPYDLLERNGVTFAAADDRGGGGGPGGLASVLSTALVYGVYAALLLSVLNRLPALRGGGLGGGAGGAGGGGPGGGGGGGGLGGAGSAAARGAGRRHGAAAPQAGGLGGRGAGGARENPLAALTAALQRRLFGRGAAASSSSSPSVAPPRVGGDSNNASTALGTTTSTAAGTATPPAVTFADVAGVDEAKEELQEVVDFLRAPARFARLGARPPSGVLLVGPPGTGKTLLARAVAGEAGVPFFSIAASEFIELYVGLGALRVRELFAAARRESPCIVFIDEIDAVAKGRGDSRRLSAGNDEREQTLNQLLTEMDGFETGLQQAAAMRAAAARRRELQARREERKRRRRRQQQHEGDGSGARALDADSDDDDEDAEDEEEEEEAALMAEADAAAAAEAAAAGVVIVLAATNRPDVLDPALLRPGRFDRRVAVERPDRVGREQILRSHIERRALPLAPDVDPSKLAASTTGFTGADLANLVNEAALLAGRRGLQEVGAEEFDAALLRSIAGIEKKRTILVGSERRTVALHEAGHAVLGAAASRLLPGVASSVERLSIVPRSGGALGFAYTPQKADDRALMYDVEVRAQLALLMGGRAAEALRSPAVSTGASDDIRRATELAVRAVSEFGLSPAVGPVHVGLLGQGGSGGGGGGDDALAWWFGGGGKGAAAAPDSAASRAEREAARLLRGALAVAADTLRCNAALHLALADLLERRERLEGEELREALKGAQAPRSLAAFVFSAETPTEAAAAAALAPMPGAGNASDDLAL
jgi:ATP-dependent Zn protease